MIRKLVHKDKVESEKEKHLEKLSGLLKESDISIFSESGKEIFKDLTIEFYEVIGELLEEIGFENVSVTRNGDTNNRMDAIIIDKVRTIPIEIKSPKEVMYVNTKSIRQALENKIVLTSRKFYPTENNVTSLAIGYEYPNDRSGVSEIIEDMYNTFGFVIGAIDLGNLLKLYYRKKNGEVIDLDKIYYLKGFLNV